MKWFRKWLKRAPEEHAIEEMADEADRVLLLKGRAVQKNVVPEPGKTILELALKHKVDWYYNCTRGTCARCRCYVEAGAEHLSEPNDAEKWRLTEEEIEEGYRLGCQAKVVRAGETTVTHRPYF